MKDESSHPPITCLTTKRKNVEFKGFSDFDDRIFFSRADKNTIKSITVRYPAAKSDIYILEGKKGQ